MRPGFIATKAQLGRIKVIDKDIDRPDRIILGQIVFQTLGKQSALTAVIANDKARRIEGAFTQPGVKTGKDQMFSASPPTTDMRWLHRNDRFVQ